MRMDTKLELGTENHTRIELNFSNHQKTNTNFHNDDINACQKCFECESIIDFMSPK